MYTTADSFMSAVLLYSYKRVAVYLGNYSQPIAVGRQRAKRSVLASLNRKYDAQGPLGLFYAFSVRVLRIVFEVNRGMHATNLCTTCMHALRDLSVLILAICCTLLVARQTLMTIWLSFETAGLYNYSSVTLTSTNPHRIGFPLI